MQRAAAGARRASRIRNSCSLSQISREPRCSGDAQLQAVVNKIMARVQFLDAALLDKKPIGNLQVDSNKWEDSDMYSCARMPMYNVYLPTSFCRMLWMRLGKVSAASRSTCGHGSFVCRRREKPPAESDGASEQSSPGATYTATETMYLKTTGSSRGVLQVHRVPGLYPCSCLV